ncbi:MAG: LytR C-terminal domain-containing protein, partial [Gemmatimonadaceae bacterium]
MKRRGLVAAGVALFVLIAAATAARGKGVAHWSRAVRADRAPDSVRVRVQVLNGTATRGLARRATMLLRDRGFDVVEMGTINESRDTTLVLDLSGHPEWAKRVARALGTARIEARADSSRYLD